MASLRRVGNYVVRAYLRRCPVTEGKKHLLAATKALVRPDEAQQTTRTKHGFSLRLNLANPEQERIYYYGEHDERYETAMLKCLRLPALHCWDVGANIGFYTCLLARLVGPSGKVVAFEPARATRERLEENVRLNGLRNVEVVACAVAAARGRGEIHYAHAGLFEGTASLLDVSGGASSESVSVGTVDDFVERFGPPDFLKIDVEGAQLDVWHGGARFFRAHAPLVLAELRESDDPAKLARIEEEVRSAGYEIYAIRKRCRVRAVARLSPQGPRNYLLAKPMSRFASFLSSRSA